MSYKIISILAIVAVFVADGFVTSVRRSPHNNPGVCTRNVSISYPGSTGSLTSKSRNRSSRMNITTVVPPKMKWKIERFCCAGYHNVAGSCKPHCPQGCMNGNCTAPRYCECFAGYERKKDSKNVCLRKCNVGEKRDHRTQACVPACNPACVNGICVAPNKCTCNEYFKPSLKKQGVCVSMCKEPCVHGKCTGYENCTCDKGYEISKNSYTCVPKCKSGCEHGWCKKPNFCACNQPDYKPTMNNQRCEPVCRGCEHGKCIAPNQCQCNEGYFRNHANDTCVPHCRINCENAWCMAPDYCECNRGYVPINETTCRLAHCSQPCINGQCLADNHCKCHSGYVESIVQNVTRCVPDCKNSCPNGICISPGNCSCNRGYQLNEKTGGCDPVCNEACVNGFSCVAPNRCGCSGTIRNITVTVGTGTTVQLECVSRGSMLSDMGSSILLIFVAILYNSYYLIN